jgi:hypothetical protein
MIKNYKNRIAIIICWSGKLPWYWSFFVKSVEKNPSIDFFIVTEEKLYKKTPSNIKIIPLSISEIRDLIKNRIKIKPNINYAYKLCDFKPTYGLIFEEYLKEYDFWGYGDIDLIFGNIRLFITDEILSNYDIISPHNQFLAGYFVLFRNVEYINTLFLKSKDFIKIAESNNCYGFDECAMLHREFALGKKYFEVNFEIETMTEIVLKDKNIKYLFELFSIQGLPGKIVWQNGNLIYDNKYEIMAYHLSDFKREPYLFISNQLKLYITDRFYVNEHSITSQNPKTIFGKCEIKLAFIKKKFYLIYKSLIWNYTLLISKSNISKNKINFISRIEGNYTANQIFISIYKLNNKFYSKKNDENAQQLFYYNDFKFIIKESKYILDFNIIDNSFLVSDLRNNKIIFNKK